MGRTIPSANQYLLQEQDAFSRFRRVLLIVIAVIAAMAIWAV